MASIVKYLWIIPAAPLLAASLAALLPRRRRRLSAGLAIGAISISFVVACAAFLTTLHGGHSVNNFRWFEYGSASVQLGWVLDPLGAIMAVMVAGVSLLIFVYSLGYMAHDENFTRFFCFLALFAAAMLGLIIANSLLLFFICWELVGLASYLLIGFWFQKPSAAAAAKKAFIVTRIGDMGFLIGMLLLYARKGTLLFYDGGHGCLEGGLAASTLIGLLIFCGAVGKSGQLPLHVWLPDAMEGPTPVSALIHAATMVAAGVFLIARVHPLMSPESLQVVTWVGALTAVFAAAIAVAQNDIKRILAYSTVSQLGYMMMGLGAGGIAVGMFHLTTHAFFKALLFMGAGSVIHGCHEEQDIANMGGLWKRMPVTFATYAVGMMALCGVPLFSGFWSKDAILGAAHDWRVSQAPFYLGLFGAFLTAFYMTRQVCAVFFGQPATESAEHAHESPSVMTAPLMVLAFLALVAGFFGTPVWPWFQSYLSGGKPEFDWPVMLLSTALIGAAIVVSAWLYGRASARPLRESDPLQAAQPALFNLLRRKFFVDEFYDATIVRLTAALAKFADWLDRAVWGGLVNLICWLVLLLARLDRDVDESVVNGGFDVGTETVRGSGRWVSRWQNGQVQRYLRVIGLAFCGLLILLLWGFPMILSMLTFLPLVAGLLVMALGPERQKLGRNLAFATSLLALVVAVVLWAAFDSARGGMQFVESLSWVPSLKIDYHLGVDGLGLLMVLLAALLVPFALLASWKIERNPQLYFALMLFLESGLFGVFTAQNFIHWFLFWELSLIPAFFLIRLWGGPRRTSAASQFFIYTMVGSIAMLAAFLALYAATDASVRTFDFAQLAESVHGRNWQAGHPTLMTAVFFGVFLGLAVKVPLVPFHTWLPAAYAEAPTGTVMLLTGAMSKMGVYGFLRILWPIFPEQIRHWRVLLLTLAAATIVLPAAAAFAQKDLKRMVAYSSINHLGYCLLGIFAAAGATDGSPFWANDQAAALNGVIVQMFNHGLTAAALFYFVGLIEQRGGTRGLEDFGGLRRAAPVFCGLMGIALFASLGLPGLNGFPGEFLIFKGALHLAVLPAVISTLGLLLTAVFLLTILQRVFSGPLPERWSGWPDLTLRERLTALPVMALIFVLGLFPQLLTGMANPAVMQMLNLF